MTAQATVAVVRMITCTLHRNPYSSHLQSTTSSCIPTEFNRSTLMHHHARLVADSLRLINSVLHSVLPIQYVSTAQSSGFGSCWPKSHHCVATHSTHTHSSTASQARMTSMSHLMFSEYPLRAPMLADTHQLIIGPFIKGP